MVISRVVRVSEGWTHTRGQLTHPDRLLLRPSRLPLRDRDWDRERREEPVCVNRWMDEWYVREASVEERGTAIIGRTKHDIMRSTHSPHAIVSTHRHTTPNSYAPPPRRRLLEEGGDRLVERGERERRRFRPLPSSPREDDDGGAALAWDVERERMRVERRSPSRSSLSEGMAWLLAGSLLGALPVTTVRLSCVCA